MAWYSRIRFRRAVFGLAIVFLLAASASQTFSTPIPSVRAAGSSSAFDYVVTVLMENNGYCDVMTTCGGSWGCMCSRAQPFSFACPTRYAPAAHTMQSQLISPPGAHSPPVTYLGKY